MKKSLAILTLVLLTTPLTRAADSPTPDTQPIMTNPTIALASQIPDLTTTNVPFQKITTFLADSQHCNLVVNWRALALANITPQTPISLSLRKISLAEALRDLFEATPNNKGGGDQLNYSIGAGVIVITTDAELGKSPTLKFTDITPQLQAAATPDNPQPNPDNLLAILRTELTNSGELPTGNGRDMLIKGSMLAVTQTPRGHLHIAKTLQLFLAPTPIGAIPTQARLTPAAKKIDDAIHAMLANKIPFTTFAQDPQKYLPDLSVIYLPTTNTELAKEKTNPNLSYEITPGGALLIAPADLLQKRTTLAIYDLRQFIRRESQFPRHTPPLTPKEMTASILDTIKTKIPANWGDLEKSPSSLTLYGTSLIVFAPTQTHRSIAQLLKDLYK